MRPIVVINAQGKEIITFRDADWAKSLEHIPFIRFDGKVETTEPKQGIFTKAFFSQMNKPVAKLSLTPIGTITGELVSETGKIPPSHYSDLWGFKNYAMARLLTPEQVKEFEERLHREVQNLAV